jgi:hypothetical protein
MSLNLGFFNQQDREAFEMLKKDYPGQVISQSYLRQSQPIANGQGAYQFSFINPQGGVAPLPIFEVSSLSLATSHPFGKFPASESWNESGKRAAVAGSRPAG